MRISPTENDKCQEQNNAMFIVDRNALTVLVPRVLLPIPSVPASYIILKYIFASHRIDSCNFNDIHVTNNTQTIA